jgi:periplasmic protein TonB
MYFLPQKSPKTGKLSAVFALAAHLTLLLAGGIAFSQPAQYGIESGMGDLEVHLTAAPALIEAPSVEMPAPETVVLDKSAEKKQAALPKQETPQFKGDGSSPVPGKDAATLYSTAGAQTLAEPNYLKNIAPNYPMHARNAGQQGVVLIHARVNERGLAEDVTLKSSSGWPLLDESALKAVRKWKFKPARIGSMPIDSQVEIPIRFQLA